jgi:photosystem II stability/assembly factor-like uncharacterized protein
MMRVKRYAQLAWVVVIVLAALGAFLVAKNRAEGPNDAVEPPAVGLPDSPDYHSLLVDPADPERILLGTHVGLYESIDGGRTWVFATLEGDDAMNLARVSNGTVWTAGHELFAKSEDGGRTWSDVRPDGLPSLDIHGFAIDPTNPARLYAAVAGEGLYRSTDGGKRFQLVSNEVGAAAFGLAATPDGRVLAAEPRRGLFASDDGGVTWQTILEGGIVAVAVNPAEPDTILATGSAIRLSTDGGESWQDVQPIGQGAGPVAWSPSHPEIAYAVGFDGNLYRTEDTGASWRAVA